MEVKRGRPADGARGRGALRLITPRMAVRLAQKIVRETIPGDDSLVDALIEERKREFERQILKKGTLRAWKNGATLPGLYPPNRYPKVGLQSGAPVSAQGAVFDSTLDQRHLLHMATLTIRILPDGVRDQLRIRAARNGRSMEAEARALLVQEAGVQPEMDEAERKRRVRAVQKAMKPYRSPGVLMSEELIAERRLEAWKETVETMHETRAAGRTVDIEAALRRPDRARRGRP